MIQQRREVDCMDQYTKPQMDVVRLSKDDTILTSGGNCDVIVEWNVSYQDGAGNTYVINGN